MGKMATALDDKLPAFQKYLLEKNLAPAKNVPFYVSKAPKSPLDLLLEGSRSPAVLDNA